MTYLWPSSPSPSSYSPSSQSLAFHSWENEAGAFKPSPNPASALVQGSTRKVRRIARIPAGSFVIVVAISTKILVFRRGTLTIRYWPKQGLLDVWRRSKVLTVERCEDDPNVVHYTAGNWEDELEATAKVSAEMRKASTPNVTATVMDDR